MTNGFDTTETKGEKIRSLTWFFSTGYKWSTEGGKKGYPVDLKELN